MQPQDIGERMGSYGLSLYLVLRPIIIMGAFIIVAIGVIKVVRDLPYSELEALIFTAAFVAPMLGTVLAAKSHCTVIHRDGLRMRDKFVSYTPVPWLQMVRVQKIAVPLLPYLVVFRADGGRTMIPLFHDKQEALEEQIISLAPVGNPLREFFLGLREKESGTSGLH